MAILMIDPMDNAAAWTPRQPDGQPSAAFTLSDETAILAFPELSPASGDRGSGRIVATSGARDHTLNRTLDPPRDLSRYEELRFFIQGDRGAGPTPAQPFYLELRLGSQALSVDSPGNSWHRYIPVLTPGEWEAVAIGIDDLPAAARSDVSQIQLRCVQAESPFTLFLDNIVAVRESLLQDADEALLTLLNERVPIDDETSVPAFITAAGVIPPSFPSIQITQCGLRFPGDIERRDERRDYQRIPDVALTYAFRLAPASVPCELVYELTPQAATRAEEAKLLEFILALLPPPQSEILVAALPRTIRWEVSPPDAGQPISLGEAASEPHVAPVRLRYVIRTRLIRTRPEPVVPPFRGVEVRTEVKP